MKRLVAWLQEGKETWPGNQFLYHLSIHSAKYQNTQRSFLSKTCQVHLKPKEACKLWSERKPGPWRCSPRVELLFILRWKWMLVRNQ